MNSKIIVKEKPKEITKAETIDKIKDGFLRTRTGYDPSIVLEKAGQEIEKEKGYSSAIEFDSNIYKAMTLFEFEKGVLMSSSIPDRFIVFALEFSRNLQKEFNCLNPSEKSMAEIIAINFVRVLELQRKIKDLYGKGNINKLEMEFLAILSKELDRAQRHYLTSLQALKMLKSPAFEVNIKTQTAVVGQNQVVQSNNK